MGVITSTNLAPKIGLSKNIQAKRISSKFSKFQFTDNEACNSAAQA